MPDTGPSPETAVIFMISITVFHSFALGSTTFRLWHRYKVQLLWLDDLWAALALCSGTAGLIMMWLLATPVNPTATAGIKSQSFTTHIIAWWSTVTCYTCTIWFARMSIVSSVFRIVPPCRSVMIASLSFVIMWLYIMAAKTVPCAMDRSWYHKFPVGCPISKWVALSEVISDTLSDFVLIFLPLRLLWHVGLPSKQRTIIFLVFSTNILTSIVSVVHTIFLFHSPFISGITAEIEGIVSLIVCNLLVLVKFLPRATYITRDPRISDKHNGPSNCLTTIELGPSRSQYTTDTHVTSMSAADANLTSITSTRMGLGSVGTRSGFFHWGRSRPHSNSGTTSSLAQGPNLETDKSIQHLSTPSDSNAVLAAHA